VPGYESVGWFGLLGRRICRPDRQTDQRGIVSAMQTGNFAIIWRHWAPNPSCERRKSSARYINADVAKWSRLVKDNDVQLPGGK